MGDPLSAAAAIGLADNVANFLILAFKISKQAYDSASGLPQQLEDIESVSTELDKSSVALADSIASNEAASQNQAPSSEEKELLHIAKNCEAMAKELVQTARKYKVDQTSRARRVKTVGQAIRLAWNKEDIEQQEKQLEKYQKQLDTRIIISLRLRFTELDKNSAARHEDLMAQSQETLKALESHSSQQDNIAKDVQEIKNLLARATSPVPDYVPPEAQANANANGSASLAIPRLVLPGSTPQPDETAPRVITTVLHEAASKGDAGLRDLRYGLRIARVPIESVDENGQTALHIGSSLGAVRVIQELCESHANPNVQDLSGRTPLHLAVSSGSISAVYGLLKAGAKDTKKDDSGLYATDHVCQTMAEDAKLVSSYMSWMFQYGIDTESVEPVKRQTALIKFTIEDDQTAVRHLIKQGAITSAKDAAGYTALMHASISGNTDMVEVLVDAEDPALEVKNRNEASALWLAAANGNVETVRLLLRSGADTSLMDNEMGYSPLVMALHCSHFAVADALRESGAAVDVETKQGNHPLKAFAGTIKTDAVAWLLKNGASVNLRSGENKLTALLLASAAGKDQIVRLLLQSGADTEIRGDGKGNTALGLAAWKSYTDIAKLLIEAGANANTMNRDGYTPLVQACRNGSLEMAQMLLDKGVYIDTRDDDDRTPLLHALSCVDFSPKLVELLLNHKANALARNSSLQTPLHIAAARGLHELIQPLLDHNAPIDAEDHHLCTPLYLATQANELDCVKLLLEKNAKIDARNQCGWTPLDEACSIGFKPIITLLLEKGADPNGGRGSEINDPNAPGDESWTPLMRAAYSGLPYVCKVLVEHGADPHLRSASGKTALDIAVRRGRDVIVRFLRSLP